MSAITYQKAKSEIGDINQLSSVGGEKVGILRDLFGRQLWVCPLIFHVFPIFDGFFHEFPGEIPWFFMVFVPCFHRNFSRTCPDTFRWRTASPGAPL